jgi:hypothetical protein
LPLPSQTIVMLAGHWGAAWLVATVWAPAPPAVLFLLANAQDMVMNVAGPMLHWETTRRAVVPPNPVLPHILVVSAPYSHSLFSTALLTPLGYAVAGAPGAAAVASHWLLDALVHYPPFMDPCWPFAEGCPRVSLGLWRFKWSSLGMEAVIVVAGAAAYTMSARKRAGAVESGRAAPDAVAAMRKTAFFVAAMVGLTFSLPYQPPPPTLDWPMGVSFLSLYFGAAWLAGRIDGHWLRCAARKAA